MTYKQFDVVVEAATKKRPALILSDAASFNQLVNKSGIKTLG